MSAPLWLRACFLALPLTAAAGVFLPLVPGPVSGLFAYRLAAVLLAVYAIYVVMKYRPPLPRAARIALVIVAAVQVWSGFANLWSPNKSVALEATVASLFPFAGFAAVVVLATVYRGLLSKLCLGIYIAFIGSVLVAAYDLVFDDHFTQQMGVPTVFQGQATSFFLNPNNFACFLVTVVAVLVIDLIQRRPWWRRVGAAGSLVVAAYFMMLTQSRTGLLGLMAVGGLTIVVYGARTRFKYWLHGAVALAVFSVALAVLQTDRVTRAFYLVYDQVFTRNDAVVQSDEYRVMLTERGWQYFIDSGLMGVGPGNYVTILNTDPQLGNQAALNPHNLLIEIASQLGVVVLVPVLYALVFVLVECMRHSTARLNPAQSLRRDDYRLLSLAMLVALVFYAIVPSSAFLESYCWLCFAIILIATQKSCDLREAGSSPWRSKVGQPAPLPDPRLPRGTPARPATGPATGPATMAPGDGATA
ncbi:O-antigen ligase family protein [Micrococcales bacterium 31B]|nr:O-antigen ligase family protein [Micrococcales bacterium 31B]